ncbi:MAG: rod shape-determining protein MreC [Ruminococcaceae bacterium]|nr:rod shape-determining protein MreC [Oscillospiraceae bacterium]
MNKKAKITIWIMIAITIIMLILVIVSGNPDRRANSIYKFIGTPVSAIQSGFSKIGTKMNSWFNVVTSYDEIEKEMESLRKENAELKDYKTECEKLEEENSELREMMSLKDTVEGYELVAANIIAGDITDWFNYFTVDCGSTDGIYKNCPVITNDGLVGIVAEVGLNSSKIMTVVDEQNTLMCRIERSNALVRVRGVSSENMKYELFLDRITDDASVFVGDKLVTAASGDVFPDGIAVGTVTKVYTDSKTGECTATVELASDISGLRTVYIMAKDGAASTAGGESAD